jgi:4a-hydroxytetrahydrobiopterin dehydratase
MTDQLTPEALGTALRALPAWSGDQTAITRGAQLPTFLLAIDLVVAVANVAEELDHHPDIDVRWRTVTFTLTTHSAGGVTTKDLDLAAQIDTLAEEFGAVGSPVDLP